MRDDDGLACLGYDDAVGIDWLNFGKGAAGMLEGAGGLMSGGKGQPPNQPPPPPPKPSIGIGTILLGIGAATVGGAIIVGIARKK